MSKKKKQTKFIGNDGDYIHYLYKITNKSNSKYYHGIHSLPKDLGKTPENDGYWGSGTGITKAIQEEGRENFTKEVIKTFSTRKELSDAEESVVTIDEVRNPQCYNMIVGGDSNDCHLGWVVCRPKSAIDKVIKISREEYYKNKDLYIITGHLKYYKTGKGTPRKRTVGKKRKNTQKIYENDRMFSARNMYVNKDTLELKTFIGHNIPENLYAIWFPHYFLDKTNNKFISFEYFLNMYTSLPNMSKLSKIFQTDKTNVRILRDYYIKEDPSRAPLFSIRGKTAFDKFFVNDGVKTITINKLDLEKYLKNGWKRGKLTKLPDKSIIVNEFVEHPSIKDLSRKYKTSDKKVKDILGFTGKETYGWWSRGDQKSHTKVPKDLELILEKAGWRKVRS